MHSINAGLYLAVAQMPFMDVCSFLMLKIKVKQVRSRSFSVIVCSFHVLKIKVREFSYIVAIYGDLTDIIFGRVIFL